jgi:nicotinamidase-related amidase
MAADTRDRRKLHDFSDVRPDNSAVLVIDMSRDFVAPGGPMASAEARELAVRLAPFLARCRAVGLPVIYVNHVHRPGARDMGRLALRFPSIAEGRALRAGTPGVAICDELTPQPGDLMVEKVRQSGFTYTPLEAVLKELGVENVMVSGVSTSACVECTARDAISRDFEVIFLSDGTANSGLPDLGWGTLDADTVQRVFLTNFAYHFGRVATLTEIIDGPLAKATAGRTVSAGA